MAEQCDVLMVDTANPGPAWSYDQILAVGGGGSELEFLQIARALADRGHRVIVASNMPRAVEEHGIQYMHVAFAGGRRARALYLARGATAPNVWTPRIVVRATDVMNEGYEKHRPLLSRPGSTIACVSRWQAEGFSSLPGDRCVVEAMIPPVPDVPKVPGRFVYASSPGRGLQQTIDAWRALKRQHRDELRTATLAIVIPGQGCDRLPDFTEEDRTELGVQFLGAPAPEEYRRIIASAGGGMFYVARPDFEGETYCVAAAFAEVARVRTHILCPNGIGGLAESLSCTRLVTTDPAAFERDFLAAWREPDRAEWYAPGPPRDRSPATLVQQWERVLFDAPAHPGSWTHGAPSVPGEGFLAPGTFNAASVVHVHPLAQASVAILTPVKNGLPPRYVALLYSVTRLLERIGVSWQWIAQPEMALTEARNFLASWVYRQTPHTHLLFIDADCAFDLRDLERLFALNVDFAGLPYVLRDSPADKPEPAMIVADPTGRERLTGKDDPIASRGGAVRCIGCGFGTVLMRRRVVEAIADAHPELHYTTPTTGVAFFQEMVRRGERLTDDTAFCRRWVDLGGEIWLLATDVRTLHAGREYRYPLTAGCPCGSGKALAQCHGTKDAA